MAAPSITLEKDGGLSSTSISTPLTPPASSTSYLGPLAGVASPITNAFSRFSSWKSSRGLTSPGTVENLQKEVKRACIRSHRAFGWLQTTDVFGRAETHLTNFIFDGARADLTKGLSMDPAFQVTHSFALASQTALPSYNFGAVFANPTVSAQSMRA